MRHWQWMFMAGALLTALCHTQAKAEQVHFGQPVDGLRVGIAVSKTATEPFEPFGVTLVLENVGRRPLQVLKYHPQMGFRGNLTADVREPSGQKLKPFVWQARMPTLSGRGAWGTQASDYVRLERGQQHRIDLTTGFWETYADSQTPPSSPRFTPGPFGPRLYSIYKAGTYRLQVQYSQKRQVGGAWSGSAETGPANVRIEAPKYPGGRLVSFTRKAARGQKAGVVAATFIGGRGIEEFIGGGEQPDGTIVAVGNLWTGDVHPGGVKPRVLGDGQWFDVSPWEYDLPVRYHRGAVVNSRLDGRHPNRSGMIVRFNEDLSRVVDAVRFDWGVASIEKAGLAGNGDIVIAGRSMPAFRKLAKDSGKLRMVDVDPDRAEGWTQYRDTWIPNDVYMARMTPDGSRFKWVFLYPGQGRVPSFWIDQKGGITYEDRSGFHYLQPDGRGITDFKVNNWGRVRTRAVSPYNRHILRGGDRNTNTGNEPWRQPLCHYFNEKGECQFEIYQWNSKLAGQYMLISDSSIRGAKFLPDGRLWLHGWSDGGNTVYERQAVDLDKGVPHDKWGVSLWGSGVGSFSHLMLFNPRTLQVELKATLGTFFVRRSSDDPNRFTDRANSFAVRQMLPLSDDGFALIGGAASYLYQTPGAWHHAPDYDWGDMPAPGGRGSCVLVFNPDWSNLMFSSGVPNSRLSAIFETRRGVVVVGETSGISRMNTEWGARHGHHYPPSINALQPAYGGGDSDAYIFMLEKPSTAGRVARR